MNEKQEDVWMHTCTHHGDVDRAEAVGYDDGVHCPVCRKREQEPAKPETLSPQTNVVSDPLKLAIDFAEWGWTIIANASGGDWGKESKDWQEAAAKYRDDFFSTIKTLESGTKSVAASPD